jgi:hypothetical protein
MKKKKKTSLLVALASSTLILSLSGCGYQGSYRYHCQDPANWGAKECVPPECKATGMCTTDLLGFDPTAKDSNTIEGSTTTGGTNG